MASSTPLGELDKAAIALALSWGAGVVDVVGYLSLHHAFVAHMSGNTVSGSEPSSGRNIGRFCGFTL